ncbi:MAG: hypothetical protein AAGC74_03360 [Verrucomicrobiota bacterium]
MSAKVVVMIGLKSSAVDFEKWPQLSVENLEAAFVKVREELEREGYRAVWCLTDTGETAEQVVRAALEKEKPACVLVGAGVRTDEDHFLLFERIINLVHECAPQARVAFNRLPYDSVEAVKRWI